MRSTITIALGLIGLGLVSGCGGGGDNAVTTVPTAHLAITLPAGTVEAAAPFTFTVSALDATNAVVPTYVGTVQITTSDKSATLPASAALSVTSAPPRPPRSLRGSGDGGRRGRAT